MFLALLACKCQKYKQWHAALAPLFTMDQGTFPLQAVESTTCLHGSINSKIQRPETKCLLTKIQDKCIGMQAYVRVDIQNCLTNLNMVFNRWITYFYLANLFSPGGCPSRPPDHPCASLQMQLQRILQFKPQPPQMNLTVTLA
jgi:hypothetical protein